MSIDHNALFHSYITYLQPLASLCDAQTVINIPLSTCRVGKIVRLRGASWWDRRSRQGCRCAQQRSWYCSACWCKHPVQHSERLTMWHFSGQQCWTLWFALTILHWHQAFKHSYILRSGTRCWRWRPLARVRPRGSNSRTAVSIPLLMLLRNSWITYPQSGAACLERGHCQRNPLIWLN